MRESWTREQIDGMFQMARENKAGDLYLLTGDRPFIKSANKLQEFSGLPLVTDKMLVDVFGPFLSEAELQLWQEKAGETEKAYQREDGLLVRLNYYHSIRGKGVTCRILQKLPTPEDLSPQGAESLKKLFGSELGLIIVSGQAGSGKTTTLAAIIDYINKKHRKAVMTIEEPIQFVHGPGSSLVVQRQVGVHCPDHSTGIRSGLRSDMDLIMIDQIDSHVHLADNYIYETLYWSVVAAENCLMLFSLRSFGCAGWTMEKLIDITPAEHRDFMRRRLSRVLRGIIWQELVPVKDSLERQPVMEIMLNTPKTAALIRKGHFDGIASEIENTDGMLSMRQSLSSRRDTLETTGEVMEIFKTIGEIGLMFV